MRAYQRGRDESAVALGNIRYVEGLENGYQRGYQDGYAALPNVMLHAIDADEAARRVKWERGE